MADENRKNVDDDRIDRLESIVKQSTEITSSAEKKYDEVGRVYTCLSLSPYLLFPS